jgi:hypothetical protein
MKEIINEPLNPDSPRRPYFAWVLGGGPCDECTAKKGWFAQYRCTGKGLKLTLCNRCHCALLESLMRNYIRLTEEREKGPLPFPLIKERKKGVVSA